MQQAMDSVVRIIQQVFQWLIQLFQFVWNWSFGQVTAAFRQLPNVASLPIWKQVLLALVALALAYLIYVVALDLWNAVRRIIDGVLGLLRALVDDLVYVLLAGIVAFAGSWAINNLTIPWLP